MAGDFLSLFIINKELLRKFLPSHVAVPAFPATHEAEAGRSQVEAGLGNLARLGIKMEINNKSITNK